MSIEDGTSSPDGPNIIRANLLQRYSYEEVLLPVTRLALTALTYLRLHKNPNRCPEEEEEYRTCCGILSNHDYEALVKNLHPPTRDF